MSRIVASLSAFQHFQEILSIKVIYLHTVARYNCCIESLCAQLQDVPLYFYYVLLLDYFLPKQL